MAKNLIEKIWDAHVVERAEGFPDILAIDLHLVHEVTSPQAFEMLRQKNWPVYSLQRTLATLDHNVSTTTNRKSLPNPVSRKQILALRKNAREFNVKLLDMGSGKQGIVHVVGPECGVTLPGMTIVCGDSHTSTHGAFGALAFGIGTSEVGYVLATSCLLQKKPQTLKVLFKGIPQKGLYAKDYILKLIQQIGVSGGQGYVLEYAGLPIEKLSMEERMTLCNMSIECGARAGLVAPDQTTYDYLKNKEAAPKGAHWDKALKRFESFKSDLGAKYDKEVIVDLDNLSPIVTWGTNPAQSVSIKDKLPKLSAFQGDQKQLAKKAYAYMDLQEGQKIEGLRIDHVFIGSCTNARLTDLKEAAQIIQGHQVAPHVKAIVVPGSEQVYAQAVKEGLKDLFESAGAEFRFPGCSSCLGMNEDKIPPEKRCASTSNRNFIGRQGPKARTHLMSPAMAAYAALAGEIRDVREVL